MNILTVDYKEVKKILTNCLGYDLMEYKYDITPATFETIGLSKNINFSWINYNPNLMDDELFRFIKFSNKESNIVVITDEMIKLGFFDIVKFGDLKEYIFEEYPIKYEATFFQEQDIILFSCSDFTVNIFSHESYFVNVNLAAR